MEPKHTRITPSLLRSNFKLWNFLRQANVGLNPNGETCIYHREIPFWASEYGVRSNDIRSLVLKDLDPLKLLEMIRGDIGNIKDISKHPISEDDLFFRVLQCSDISEAVIGGTLVSRRSGLPWLMENYGFLCNRQKSLFLPNIEPNELNSMLKKRHETLVKPKLAKARINFCNLNESKLLAAFQQIVKKTKDSLFLFPDISPQRQKEVEDLSKKAVIWYPEEAAWGSQVVWLLEENTSPTIWKLATQIADIQVQLVFSHNHQRFFDWSENGILHLKILDNQKRKEEMNETG